MKNQTSFFYKRKSVFRSRVLPALLITTVSLLAFCSLDGWPFRIIFVLICGLAIYELSSFRYTIRQGGVSSKSANCWRGWSILFVIEGGFYIMFASRTDIFLLFICAWGADIMGWLIGRTFGGRFSSKKPFPELSPNKTWEGTWAHILAPFLIFGVMLLWRYFAGGPLFGIVDVDLSRIVFAFIGLPVLAGDLLGSKVKRVFGAKNSCDHAAPRYRKCVRRILGDHGGALDRIDSIVVVATMLLLFGWICILVFKV